MSTEKRLRFWLIGLLAVFVVLFLLRSVLLPFVAGMAVAYFLDPAADRLEAWGCSRAVATSLITATFFILLLLVTLLVLPLLQKEIIDFTARIPDYVEALRGWLSVLLERVQNRISPQELDSLRVAITKYLGEVLTWLGALVSGIWSGGVALANLLALIVITPVVCFYLLRDWDRMVAKIDGWLPRQQADVIREQMRLIDETLAGFVRGQGLVCLILGTYYGVGLTLAGLDFGLVVGFGAGLISFIPYVGSLLGLVVSLGLALGQFDQWQDIAVVAGVFVTGQLIEGYVLSPKLVGDRVHLHPVWIIFALLAGGALLGFVGVLLAVPVAAMIGVLGRFSLERYLASPLYHGASKGGGDAGDSADRSS